MSNKIMMLCWPLQVPPTAKAVLISMADQANDEGVCWPSLDVIAARTCVSRRSVVDAVKALEAHGVVLADRSNGRHTTYKVTPEAYRPVDALVSARTAARREAATRADAALPTATNTEPTGANAAPLPVQMPHWSEEQTSANAALTGADAALPPVQMPHQPVQMPHSNHKEPSIEPSLTQRREGEDFQLDGVDEKPAEKKPRAKKSQTPGFDPAAVELPEWLGRELWTRWIADLKARKKTPTEEACRLQLKHLGEYRATGHAPLEVVELSIASRWSSLYPPKTIPRAAATSRHGGLTSKDPSKGIQDDGSFSL